MVLSLCIIAIGLSVTLMLINRQNSDVKITAPVITPDDNQNQGEDVKPDEPVEEIITFIMPVANAIEIGEYSETMVFNQTLDRFSVHKAIDFFAEEGSSVLCVYDGVVESVTSTLLQGTSIVINHGNGLKSVYNSVADGELVKQGDKVKKGQVIGEVSVTNRQEYQDGAHLHFEVIENDKVINPSKYLVLNEK